MKLSRDELKNIVKECLVEILSEGLSSPTNRIMESKLANRHTLESQRTAGVQTRSGISDKISFLPKGDPAGQEKRRSQIDRSAIRAATSDPILQEMLADTATLGTPILDESKVSASMHESAVAVQGDVAAKHMLRSDPTDLFGDASSKWAVLAFSEKKIGA